ncbi:FYVE zinc finger domain-containing protein [Phytophthora infestans]|uniref:FYVE zinc finger domain-containing protein n=1 Tax=Phytophthora infestans TaxID=4787 RepID=A0A833WH75_PHYIN|nr:FYVE zinc finger domain-containing protein [Phytophthora infestans]
MASAVHLSHDRAQTRRMHHRATRQITDVLGVCLNSTRTKEQWTCLRRDKQQELYAKRTGQGVSNGTSVYYLAVNEASCGFEEAFDLLHFDSTKQFRLMMKLLHGRDFKDGTLLSTRTKKHSISDWTMDTQHAAVWFVYQDRRKSVMLREQHLTFFQTLKIFLPDNQHQEHDYHSAAASMSANSSMAGLSARPSDGVHKRTIALSWLPFPRSHEAMLETAQQVDLQYTLIVEEISPNRLRLSCVTSSFHDENDGPLAGSPRAARAIARRLAMRSVGRLESAVAASRIGDCQLVAPHQWVKNEDRASCVICWKHFNAIFRRRHHCRLCGEVICGSCCSLRSINIVSARTKEVQKTRICHLCNNKARLKTSSRGFSSNNHHSSNYNSRAPPSRQRREPTPMLESESEFDLPLSLRALPPSLKLVAGQDFMLPPRSVDLLLTGPVTMDPFEDSDRTHEFDSTESDGYIGALPGRFVASVNSKIISIKSIARSTKNLWQAVPSTTSSMKSIWSLQALDSNSVESSINFSGWDGGYKGVTEASYSGVDAPRSGFTVSRSFLHPVAMASRSRRMAQPIPLAAEASSYSSADRSFMSSYRLVDSKEREEEDLRRFDHRRTSLMSSNVGLLDQDSIADEAYFLPRLDDDREEERLKLLEVIVSPACTLVDRMLMHRSCELAAAAFGVNAAFIARVDAEYVLIEHAVGTRDLAAQDEILRRESLCDFVLCQPPNQPLVVLDCLADPRTREIPMVQHLRMHFFIGISVCVRGLPIACLCAFGQDEDKQSEENHRKLTASFYDSGILENAARQMEDELESLVYGLELC